MLTYTAPRLGDPDYVIDTITVILTEQGNNTERHGRSSGPDYFTACVDWCLRLRRGVLNFEGFGICKYDASEIII